MSLSQIVVNLLHAQSGLTNQSDEIVGMIHLTVSVGERSKVEARHGKAECSRLKPLSVPKRFHDEEARVSVHCVLCALQDAYDLLFGEAVEELRHPHGIKSAVALREEAAFVKKVDAVSAYSVGSLLAFNIVLHQSNLLLLLI